MKKIQYIALRVFFIATVLCAGLMLSIVWSHGPDTFSIINQIALTSFVVGLFSFLVWIVSIIIEIKDKIVKK